MTGRRFGCWSCIPGMVDPMGADLHCTSSQILAARITDIYDWSSENSLVGFQFEALSILIQGRQS